MNIPISAAKAQLTSLVRRAEAGEDVVLTRRGEPVARVTAARPTLEAAERTSALRADRLRAFFEELREENRVNPPAPGPSAARSQDFLYDEDGLPG